MRFQLSRKRFASMKKSTRGNKDYSWVSFAARDLSVKSAASSLTNPILFMHRGLVILRTGSMLKVVGDE